MKQTDRGRRSKYPPAEPEALCFEPLKAADVADELQHFFLTHQRIGRPILADFGEQSMFNRIPFGSPAGILRHGHG